MDSRFGARTFFDMYWLALRYSIPPLEYVVYGLDTPLRRAALHQYLYWNDLPAFAAINRQLGADNRDVQDKDRFARICARHGLPHVPTLAVFDHGSQRYPDAPFVPAAPLLWSKALRLKGGAGGTKWSRIGDVYRNSQSELLSASALAEAFLGQDCIVQPVLENHPAIAPITNGALATVRLVTGLDRSGEAVFVTSLLSLPRGANDTGIGGILCAIDRQTGRLTKAIDPAGAAVARHPDTGISIAGTVLPFWSRTVELVRRAHEIAFPRFAFLGWDVALTAIGPVLLETNSGWSALHHQMLDGPLGETEFSRLVGQYV